MGSAVDIATSLASNIFAVAVKRVAIRQLCIFLLEELQCTVTSVQAVLQQQTLLSVEHYRVQDLKRVLYDSDDLLHPCVCLMSCTKAVLMELNEHIFMLKREVIVLCPMNIVNHKETPLCTHVTINNISPDGNTVLKFWVTNLFLPISEFNDLSSFALGENMDTIEDDLEKHKDDGKDKCNGKGFMAAPQLPAWLPITLLGAASFIILMFLLPYDPTGEIKVPLVIFNACPPCIFHVWVISTMFAFSVSIVSFKLIYTREILAKLCAYVAVFNMLLALAFFTLSLMWAIITRFAGYSPDLNHVGSMIA